MRTLAYLLGLTLLVTASCGDNGTGAGSDGGGGGGLNQCPAYDLALSGGAADMPSVGPCGGQTCGAGQVCRFNACVATPAACNTDSQCQGDSYCQASECIPYGVGPRGSSNAQCKRITTMGVFSPKIKCRWSGPAAGDPYPNHKTVLSSPVVVDFDLDKDPQKIKPSIVFTSGNCAKSCQSEGGGCYGVVRVIDGDTCQPQFSLSAPAGALIIEQTPPSVADLNGDKRPDLIVLSESGAKVEAVLTSVSQGSLRLENKGGPALPAAGRALTVADLNGDGKVDLAVPSSGTSTVIVLLNSCF